MHCSEEYLHVVVYSAHSVGKRSERKDGCFHRLHLFVKFRTVFFLLFCVFCVLPTYEHGLYSLFDLFLFSVRCEFMFVLYFFWVIPTLILYCNLFYVIWLPRLVNSLVILGSQHPF